jgi:hypothetical protein
MGVIAVVALLLTVFPLVWIADIRRSPRLAVTAVYFGLIGLAYLMLEITLLSRLTHLMGDPVLAGAATIAGFLLFSGIGSLVSQRLARSNWVPNLMLALAAVGVAEAWLVGWATTIAGSLPIFGRFTVAMVIIGPLGFLMGFPLPSALRRLQHHAPSLVPWAWGVNGFASVMAPPLAMAIGMTVGFWVAGGAALIYYVIAAWVFSRLPTTAPPTEIA